MQKWEYRTVIWVNDASSTGKGDGAAWNMHGGDGWECFAVLPYEDAKIRELYVQKGIDPEEYFPRYIGFFKRPLR